MDSGSNQHPSPNTIPSNGSDLELKSIEQIPDETELDKVQLSATEFESIFRSIGASHHSNLNNDDDDDDDDDNKNPSEHNEGFPFMLQTEGFRSKHDGSSSSSYKSEVTNITLGLQGQSDDSNDNKAKNNTTVHLSPSKEETSRDLQLSFQKLSLKEEEEDQQKKRSKDDTFKASSITTDTDMVRDIPEIDRDNSDNKNANAIKVQDIKSHDVFFTRGKIPSKYTGNLYYKTYIQDKKKEYAESDKNGKTAITWQTLLHIKDLGGKFYVQHKSKKEMVEEISDAVVRKKISQAFRDSLRSNK